jgi:hypothetical protein
MVILSHYGVGGPETMTVPTIFQLCTPRADVIAGTSSDADFAADLFHVVRGSGGPEEYAKASLFFANTFPKEA